MNQRMISIIIVGARGRMGTALIREVMDSEDMTLGACVDRSGGPGIGQDAGRLAGRPDVGMLRQRRAQAPARQRRRRLLLPKATETNVNACIELGIPLIIGTTGLNEEQDASCSIEAGSRIPIVYAPNFSVGVTLLLQLAAVAAPALGPDWEAELVELHHRHKRDSPSGTALRIAKAVAEATDRKFSDVVNIDRSHPVAPAHDRGDRRVRRCAAATPSVSTP